MWTWLAWFITFNFVNIAWVFFRAKEWDDAIKVLSSMFKLDDIVLPNFLSSKLAFLNNYGIEFGGFVVSIQGDKFTIIWIIMAFIIILLFRNSMEKWKEFKINFKTLFLTYLYFVYGILSLNKISEFLYFNF